MHRNHRQARTYRGPFTAGHVPAPRPKPCSRAHRACGRLAVGTPTAAPGHARPGTTAPQATSTREQ